MAKDIKEKVREWAAEVGYDNALIKLKRAGVSISMGQKLLAKAGYKNEIKTITSDAIKKAMAS